MYSCHDQRTAPGGVGRVWTTFGPPPRLKVKDTTGVLLISRALCFTRRRAATVRRTGDTYKNNNQRSLNRRTTVVGPGACRYQSLATAVGERACIIVLMGPRLIRPPGFQASTPVEAGHRANVDVASPGGLGDNHGAGCSGRCTPGFHLTMAPCTYSLQVWASYLKT